ncbi:oligopeptidase B, partial [Elysia marginata]
MKARIKEETQSVPYKKNGYWYITKYKKTKEYPIYTRRKESLEAEEEILFDCNQMAKGNSFFDLSGISISPDNSKVAYGVDTVGRRLYTTYIKDLKTDE